MDMKYVATWLLKLNESPIDSVQQSPFFRFRGPDKQEMATEDRTLVVIIMSS